VIGSLNGYENFFKNFYAWIVIFRGVPDNFLITRHCGNLKHKKFNTLAQKSNTLAFEDGLIFGKNVIGVFSGMLRKMHCCGSSCSKDR